MMTVKGRAVMSMMNSGRDIFNSDIMNCNKNPTKKKKSNLSNVVYTYICVRTKLI